MTDLEKAKEIVAQFPILDGFERNGLIDLFTVALAEAQEEGIKQAIEQTQATVTKLCDKAYAEGRKAGLEEAIQKIRDHKRSWQVSIEAIRALAKERK